MAAKALLLLALVAAAAAEGRSRERSYGSYDSYESEEPKYDFNYQVKDYYGNDYGHRESRDGDYTEGFYYNHLPDGRLQKVKYVVDGYSGFVADVSYEGEAHYDSGSYESRGSGSSEYYRPRYYRGSDESK
ncbi:pro-resilin-like [Scylla paramamosain]|uniref:pro-resilin-like n=1 Tax=Scylla paramamosain TaxID=85552 RepID=UPI003083339A